MWQMVAMAIMMQNRYTKLLPSMYAKYILNLKLNFLIAMSVFKRVMSKSSYGGL